MAINPLRLPGPVSPARIDWSPLSQIGDVIAAEANKRRISDVISANTGPDGNFDAGKAGASLARLGLIDQARPFLALAQSQANSGRAQANADRAFAFQQSQAERAQGNADRAYQFQVEQASKPRLITAKDEYGNPVQKLYNPATGEVGDPGPRATLPAQPQQPTPPPQQPTAPIPPEAARLADAAPLPDQARLDDAFKAVYGNTPRREIPRTTGPTSPTRLTGVDGNDLSDPTLSQPAIPPAPPGVNRVEYEKVRAREAAKLQAEFPQNTLKVRSVSDKLSALASDAEEILGAKNLKSVIGARFPQIWGTEGYSLLSRIEGLKSKIAGAALQEMREASKTGGAVGSVTEAEWPRLEALIARLDTRANLETFRKVLQELITYTKRASARTVGAYHMTYPKTRGRVMFDAPQAENATPGTIKIDVNGNIIQ